MMKKTAQMVGSLMIALAVMMMVGCETSSLSQDLTGSWEDPEGEVLTFNADGTFTASDWSAEATGTWEASEGSVTITKTEDGDTGDQVYTYIVLSNTLTLTRNGVVAGPYTKR